MMEAGTVKRPAFDVVIVQAHTQGLEGERPPGILDLRGPDGRYRRDHPRALARRVEVAEREVRIMGSKTTLPRTRAAASGVNAATAGVPSFVPSWRRGRDSNPGYPAKGTTVFETAPIDRSGTSPETQA
jgi:hypothetical protein